MNLKPEQLAYLKSLESPKKRRKFMLDCLVKNALGESVKFEEEINRLNSSYQTSTAPATLKGLLNFCGVSDEKMSNSVFRESAKSNYTPEEIEIAKSLNSEREEKKWTDEDMIRAFEKGNYATCNAFTLREKPSQSQLKSYIDQKDEFIKSLKND